MLYELSQYTDVFSPLRVFRYVTFRALGGAATAFFLSLLIGPWLIARLRALKVSQRERTGDAPTLEALRKGKKDVPTMGGLMIVFSVTVASLLWSVPTNRFLLLTLAAMLYLGAVGFWDDYLKVTGRNRKGLAARHKMLLQTLWAVAATAYLWEDPSTRRLVNELMLPFLKEPWIVGLGVGGALLLVYLVVVGCSNAVNLTDGLDGLAIGCTNAVALAYLIMSYVAGHAVFARHLQIPFVPGAEELAVFCACLLGAGLGFLWFNCHPAAVFMGDTGSLALGGAIAMVALLIQQEVTLIIVGLVFVAEALSVMIQVAWFKLSGGRRVFLCSPLHHHYEWIAKERAKREGRPVEVMENLVTVRFWIVSIVCALLGVATLKIR